MCCQTMAIFNPLTKNLIVAASLHSLSISKPFISFQDLSELIASVTNVWINPLELVFASLANSH